MSHQQVIVWWDSGSEPEKWEVDVRQKEHNGHYEFILDSRSEEFPVRVEDFGPFEEDTLIQNLKEAFPDAEIMLRF
ncbi:MAG: hypothetical protein HGB29_04555 [Chlorobiaceae bacterium]|nr:hypothetical protein [Chlorobiaceae bacterium]NTW74116.1 hypothetical protein [Chlorobiaceae bacterium]